MQGTRNNGADGRFGGKYPAVVMAYDKDKRQCTVDVLGFTYGCAEFPIAEIEYPIGDRSGETELKILPGDDVWVSFQAEDPRFPVITGFRCKNAGNGIDWRKFHHANVGLSATAKFVIEAGEIELKSAKLTHNGKNIGHDHTHKDVVPGSGNSGEPT